MFKHVFTQVVNKLKLNVSIYYYPSFMPLCYEVRPCVSIDGKQWLLDPIDTQDSHTADLEFDELKSAIEAHGILIPEGLLDRVASLSDVFNVSDEAGYKRTKYYDFNSRVPRLSESETSISIPSKYDYLVDKANLVGVFFIGYSADRILNEMSLVKNLDCLRQFIERLDNSYHTDGGVDLSVDDWMKKITPAITRQRKLMDEQFKWGERKAGRKLVVV